jgi:hypothetical protein
VSTDILFKVNNLKVKKILLGIFIYVNPSDELTLYLGAMNKTLNKF